MSLGLRLNWTVLTTKTGRRLAGILNQGGAATAFAVAGNLTVSMTAQQLVRFGPFHRHVPVI